jgi:hypothetical protein
MPSQARDWLSLQAMEADIKEVSMLTQRKSARALHWQLDPEHEVFRGVGARAAARLGLVLAIIAVVLGSIAINTTPHRDGEEASSLLGRLPMQLERFFSAQQSG